MSELAPLVTLVRRSAEAALLRRFNAGSGFADPRVPSQIYLRDDSALARIAGGTLRPQRTHERAAEELARVIAEHKVAAAREGSRFTVMSTRLGLGGSATGIALVALGYALDLDTRELCHTLAPRRRAALYLETIADVLQVEPAAILRAVAPGSALRRGRAIVLDGDGLAASVELPNATLAWLLGEDAVQPPLASACELVPPNAQLGVHLTAAATTELDAVVPRLAGDVAIIVRGPRGSGRRGAAHRLARALGRPLFVIDVPALIAVETRTRSALFANAVAAARIRDAVPYLADAEALYDERGEMVAEHADALAALPGVVFAGTAKSGHLELARPVLDIVMPRSALDDREAAWRAALTAFELDGIAPELAGRYVIGPGAIADVVAEAARYARAAARP
ncbi:MAG TPA: hypothetical protein VK427_04400, partial [Kofleriaceae bacterium]|nr:hypothetical protein [Kofleriaceae bacterium]